MKEFGLAFLPLFVAIDALGTVPMFLHLTSGSTELQRRRMIGQAIVTAFAVALLILLCGNSLFSFLGITIDDFKIAGGLILLVISVMDLATPSEPASKAPMDPENFGVVPLGIPLILGPAAMTTLLILSDSVGLPWTLASLTLNLALAWVVFRSARWVERILTKNGAGAFAKVSSLFLAAIAVMMIRSGWMAILKRGTP